MDQEKISLGLRIAIIIGIACLFPATVYYGVATFSDRPERPKYEASGPNATQAEKQTLHEKRKAEKEIYQQKQKEFSLRFFWVMVPLGFLAIGLGLFHKLADIGTGFMFAGIISVGTGNFGTWGYIADELRFVSLLVVLLLLLFVSFRRLFSK